MLMLGRRHDVRDRGRARVRRHRRRRLRGPGRRGLPRLARRARAGPRRYPGGESRLARARALRRRLCARCSRGTTRAACCSSCTTCRSASCTTPCSAADPLDGPGAHRREPRAPERGRGAARGRSGRDAAQALVAFRRSDRAVVSDRSARSGRRAPGARCRSPRPPRPADDDRSRCTTSDACYEYAANCNNLSICTRCKPLEGVRCPATIARCGRRSSLAVRAASGWP